MCFLKTCRLFPWFFKNPDCSKLLIFLLLFYPLFMQGHSNSLDKKSGSNEGAEKLNHTKIITFAGYNWLVKSSTQPVGPGPNFFSDSTENVRVDAQGRLHLAITHRDGKWHCAEVILMGSFGYGRYVFQLATPVGRIDPQATLGLFTWDSSAPANHNREIDIEIGRWGIPFDPTNSQYVVQPYTTPGNLVRFTTPDSLAFSTHSFEWTPDSIKFLSVKGHQSTPPYDSLISSFTYTGPDIQPPGIENTRMNLWLFRGFAPLNGQGFEVIVSNFKYFPPAPVGIDETPETRQIPEGYALFQNFPNPFNPQTTISFFLPQQSSVKLTIYDLLGKEVAVLAQGLLPAGTHQYLWNAAQLSGGLYFYRLTVSKGGRVKFHSQKKLLLIK